MLGSMIITLSKRGPRPSPVRKAIPRRYPSRSDLLFSLSGVLSNAKISPRTPRFDSKPACKRFVYIWKYAPTAADKVDNDKHP